LTTGWLRCAVAEIAADPHTSVSVASRRRDHDVNDVILYLEAIHFTRDLERPED